MTNIKREDVEKYVRINNSIQIKQDEGGFFASIPDLPGCMSQGNTLEEAYAMIMDAKAAWIEAALKNGETIPEPIEDKKHSGRILLRIPPALHAELAENALRQEVSLNQYLIYLLTKANEKVEYHFHHTNKYDIGKIEVNTTPIDSRTRILKYD